MTKKLGFMFAVVMALFVTASPASAQTASSTDGGLNLSVAVDVENVCSAPANDFLTWKLESRQQEDAVYVLDLYGDGVGNYYHATGTLPQTQSKILLTPRKGVVGKTVMNMRWGRADYPYESMFVNQGQFGENWGCFPEFAPKVEGQVTSTSTVATSSPSEELTIKLMTQIIELYKQMIVLLTAKK